jgi:hypothetical protein
VRTFARWLARLGLAGTSLLAVLGAVLAFGVVYVGYPFPKRWNFYFHGGPYFQWLVLFCAQTAMWFAVVPTLLRTLIDYGGRWRENQRQVIGVCAAFALLVALPLTIGTSLHAAENPLPNHVTKTYVITALGLATALLGVAGISLVDCSIDEASGQTGKVTTPELERYFSLRSALLKLLTIEAAILAAAILAVGALRHALNNVFPGDFSEETLVAFGAYLSGTVALVYIPPYVRLRSLGRELRDRLVPLAGASLTKSLGDRQNAESLLGLDVTAGSAFQQSAAILAPFATSLVGLLIGSGG